MLLFKVNYGFNPIIKIHVIWKVNVLVAIVYIVIITDI